MLITRITVYRNDRPLSGASVSLEYNGIAQNGFTAKFTTNADGVAYVEHTSTGRASVFINGSKKGSVFTPGQEVYYL